MRIGLDARTVYWPHRRGTGKTLVHLYRQLARLRPHWQVVAYHRQSGAVEPLLPKPHVSPRLIEMPGDRLDAWQRWRLPMAAWRDGVDLLHCPANACPGWTPVPTVVTVHDLIPLDMSAWRQPDQVRQFVRGVRTACRRAAWIVTPSRYTHDRLVSEFDADPNRMSVVPWGPDDPPAIDPQRRAGVLERFGVSKPFVLHLGASMPRKNTRRLLEVWGMLDGPLRDHHQLLVVGLDPEACRDFKDQQDRGEVPRGVQFFEFASEAELAVLLAAATVLAYPSLSEGFGLPILDAQAVDTAVLTSDRTSMPEIAGDGALLVEPTDPGSIASGLSGLLSDDSLRSQLIARGGENVAKYSWAQTARTFATALEQVVDVTNAFKIAC